MCDITQVFTTIAVNLTLLTIIRIDVYCFTQVSKYPGGHASAFSEAQTSFYVLKFFFLLENRLCIQSENKSLQ